MLPDNAPISYLIIGHICKDLTPSGAVLGGTAAYAGCTARALTQDVGILTSVESEVDLSPLAGIQMTIVPSARTTTFENEYSPAGRRQKLTAYAEKLSPKALPQVWRQADIVHLGPIAQEVDPELTRSFPASFIGITPQGWLRAWDKHGHVRLETWETLKGSVAQASVVILSIEDLGGDEGAVEDLAKLCSILVVTRAAEGATVYWNDQAHDLPAPEQKEVESTGAGDIFAAAFFVRLRETKNPLEAGRFANFLASASVTRRGLASTPTQEEIAAAKSKVVP